MKPITLTLIFLLTNGCVSNNNFELRPAKFGQGKSGFIHVEEADSSITLTIFSIENHSPDVLEQAFHKKASQFCGGYKYTMISFDHLVDICSSGGCFDYAVEGRFKCT